MRVVTCQQFGPPQDLVVEERRSAPLAPGLVRVEVRAAGVNYVDGLFVQGLYQIKPPTPFVPGGEVAGVVSEVGAGVSDRFVGQRVFCSTGLGGFASEVVVPASRANPTPDSMTDGQAATFVQSYMTAWFALRVRARAEFGHWVLVRGAGGGVGLAAVDVGTAMGLRVIAAASSDEKREMAVSRGAVATIDTLVDDMKARVREISGGGVDLVYDPVGGDDAENALRSLRDAGQYLVVGFAGGSIPRFTANHVLLRNRSVVGVDWGGWSGGHPEENTRMLAEVIRAIEQGEIHPVEPVAYPFERAGDALADQLSRQVVGKSVLVP